MSSSRSIPNKIIGEGTTYPIGGWVTEDGICDRVCAAFDGYRKMGATTGETTGGLGKYHIDDSYSGSGPSFEGHGVRGSADAAKIDSGGPAFSLHGGDAYLTHMISQGDKNFGKDTDTTYHCHSDFHPFKKSLGPAAYYIHNEYNYEIQGSSRS